MKTKTFSVIEYHSFFAVRHNASGREHHMSDGVDSVFYPSGRARLPGTKGFTEAWEKDLNANKAETMEAYFPQN